MAIIYWLSMHTLGGSRKLIARDRRPKTKFLGLRPKIRIQAMDRCLYLKNFFFLVQVPLSLLENAKIVSNLSKYLFSINFFIL